VSNCTLHPSTVLCELPSSSCELRALCKWHAYLRTVVSSNYGDSRCKIVVRWQPRGKIHDQRGAERAPNSTTGSSRNRKRKGVQDDGWCVPWCACVPEGTL